MKVRPATIADAEPICRIYNREVTESTVTLDLVPRTLAEQRSYLAQRSGGLAVLVAEQDGDVVGFGSLSFYRDRPGYRTSVEDSVYVDRAHVGAGVGSTLLAGLLDVAADHGFHARVRPGSSAPRRPASTSTSATGSNSWASSARSAASSAGGTTWPSSNGCWDPRPMARRPRPRPGPPPGESPPPPS